MKKYISILFIGGILISCENNENKQLHQNNIINDSIKKVREQEEVINLNIDDSNTFDNVLKE